MPTKPLLVVIGIGLAGLIAAFFFVAGPAPDLSWIASDDLIPEINDSVEEPKIDPAVAKPSAVNPETVFVAQVDEEGVRYAPQMVELTKELHSPEASAEDDIELVHTLLNYYRQMARANPRGGENYEITAGLQGKNKQKVGLIPKEHPGVNPETGELLDRWGTPFHFHPISSQQMEVTSAGPDKRLWTEDDVTIQK